MDLYYKKDIDNLQADLEIKANQFITIDTPDMDNIHFDGYADVFDCIIHVHTQGLNTTDEYDAVITQNVLCYFHNGE